MKAIVLYVILSLQVIIVVAQSHTEMEQIFLMQVKQFDEFIKRFNYEIDPLGNPVDSIFENKISRKEYVHSLFNLSDSRLNSNSPNEYAQMISEFEDHVCENKQTIHKGYQHIIAKAKSQIYRNDKLDTIEVFLNREYGGYGIYKWVIVDVHDDYYLFQEQDTTGRRFLSPMSNETNFIALQRAFNDKEHLIAYTEDGFVMSNLSLFIYDLYYGRVKFGKVIDLTYLISDIPGWEIQVKEFKRTTTNSGWLISNLRNDH